ncbi:hypothetical protein FHS42_007414 [Streptomyces zagrosensis]|uniref:Uncharacterized protein n=1 Tax=Streptomyces zagrosensis TaxID=1042984 RepID=A0A7W9QHE1_9ACTN|nr:hypothetical protein [Streptomyces zagrosensis]
MLRPHEVRDGYLPGELVGNDQRAQIKRDVLTALEQGTWQQATPPRPQETQAHQTVVEAQR